MYAIEVWIISCVYVCMCPICVVVDQIRTVVGQAELLMRKKMKQYLGLVTGAEDGSDCGNTSAQDLQVHTCLYCSSIHISVSTRLVL